VIITNTAYLTGQTANYKKQAKTNTKLELELKITTTTTTRKASLYRVYYISYLALGILRMYYKW
jgi:hypothetical protein